MVSRSQLCRASPPAANAGAVLLRRCLLDGRGWPGLGLHPSEPDANRAATHPGGPIPASLFVWVAQPVPNEDFNRVETSGGIQASLSGRYATALFELARDAKTIDTVEASLANVRAALDQSDEFARLVAS